MTNGNGDKEELEALRKRVADGETLNEEEAARLAELEAAEGDDEKEPAPPA